MQVNTELFTPSKAYKPFRFPWAYEAWLEHEKMHWLHDEFDMSDDVKDWNNNLEPHEKNLITQILRLFTQQDADVESAYLDLYLPKFKPTEIRMMLSGFASRENTHMAAYSHLLETVGMPETEYEAFLDYKEMADKHHYLKKFNMDTPHNTALSMAVFGAFTEGLALFASFIMLLSFQRNNRMKSMCSIVDYSLRDENMHVQAIIRLYHELRNSTPGIDANELDQDIYTACHEIVTNEDAFIDLAFEMGDVKGLTREGVKSYIRFIADRRLQQLGLEPIYGIEENPEPWIDDILSSPIHTNFFEGRATEYTKAATTGTWSDVFPN